MPTFTAIALDSLLEPGRATKPPKPPNPNPELQKSSSATSTAMTITTTTAAAAAAATAEKRFQWASLYATPEATPLPDSPSSFSPSPYIVNHKRRGPRLRKTSSRDNGVGDHQQGLVVEIGRKNVDDDCQTGEMNGQEVLGFDNGGGFCFAPSGSVDCEEFAGFDGYCNGRGGNVVGDAVNGVETGNSDCDDFFDSNETMSSTSSVIGAEGIGGFDSSFKMYSTPHMAVFFDACDELHSEGSPQYSLCNMETELRGIRLNLSTETEKRKQAEETLDSMRSTWRKFTEQLSLVGLRSLETEAIAAKDEKLAYNFVEELCRHIYVVQVVSDSISRGLAKAEAEIEMESQIEAKNFEITRLWDRVRYYEAVNHEMSQRNQEAIELARYRRQRRKRRQRLVWGSIGAAISLGTAALAWSFLPSHTSSPSYSLDRDESPRQ